MITKRTDELRPGDQISLIDRHRTVVRLSPRTGRRFAIVLETDDGANDLITVSAGYGWEVYEPDPTPTKREKLDLAVQRAQELADQFDSDGVNAREISELFDLFRATR